MPNISENSSPSFNMRKKETLEYIEIIKHFSEDLNYEDMKVANQTLKELERDLKSAKMSLSAYDIRNALNDSKNFNTALTTVFNTYQTEIKDGDLQLFSRIVSLIMDVYCEKHNINVGEIDFEIDENAVNDSLVTAYLKEIGGFRVLSHQEEINLFERLKNGDNNARDLIIKHNLKLVVSFAKKRVNQGLDFMDLISEGNMGLIKAIDRFDYTKGYKFSTYASWWIRQSIDRGITDKGKTIRIPCSKAQEYNKFKKIKSQLEKKLGREPTYKELAKELGEEPKYVEETLNLPDADKVSLNQKLTDDSDEELIYVIPSKHDIIEEEVDNIFLDHTIEQVLNRLKEREKDVIVQRYGLFGNQPKTLEQIAVQYHVTKERIRQIEKKALNKLKHPNNASILREYSNDGLQKKEYTYDKAVKDNNKKSQQHIHVKTIEEIEMQNYYGAYEYFEKLGYRRVDISKTFNSLTDDEKEILKKRFGEDLKSPRKPGQMSEDDFNKYYYMVLPKIKNMLEKLNTEYLIEENGKILQNVSSSPIRCNLLNEINEFVTTSRYKKLSRYFSHLEILLIALNKGLINDKKYPLYEVAIILNRPIDVIIEMNQSIEEKISENKKNKPINTGRRV